MSQKNRTPTIFWNNFTKTDLLSMIFGREDRYSFAYKLWVKIWYGSRTISTVSIETVAQDRVPAERDFQQWNSWVGETSGFISPELWLRNSPNFNCVDCRTRFGTACSSAFKKQYVTWLSWSSNWWRSGMTSNRQLSTVW